MALRKKFGLMWLCLFLLVAGLWLHSRLLNRQQRYRPMQQVAAWLLLTDFSLSTESRHTRNIALPEPLAPFQDLPGFHEHFPSSSFFQPPPYIGRGQQQIIFGKQADTRPENREK